MTKLQIKHSLGALVAVLVIVLMLIAIYMNFIDGRVVNKPIVFSVDTTAIEVDHDGYERGQEVKGHFVFCKKRTIKTLIQWTLVDHTLTFFPSRYSTITKGCYDLWAPIQQIPKNASKEPNMYFEGLIQYQVNPFSVVTVPLKTKTFEIK